MGFCNCSMFCCALHFMSILVLLSSRERERAGCFALFIFLVSRDSCVALPYDAMGLSAVCDRGIS